MVQGRVDVRCYVIYVMWMCDHECGTTVPVECGNEINEEGLVCVKFPKGMYRKLLFEGSCAREAGMATLRAVKLSCVLELGMATN